MADIRPVTDSFAVAPQVRPDELAALAGRFALVINNRPDAEDPGQPAGAEVAAAAAAAGLEYRHIPVVGAPSAEQVGAMREAVGASPGPVLAFCRSGTRSITTWALAEALNGRPVPELEAQGRAAGYDLGPALSTLLPRLRGG